MSAASATVSRAGVLRDQFPVFEHARYLNTCSMGALSLRSRQRVNEYLDLWNTRGAAAWHDVWWAALAELRERYGRVIGAAARDVALVPNISAALGAVAESLDYARRPRVVITSLDFPTVAYQWLAKQTEGVETVVVESPDGIEVPLERVERAVDDRTAIVATSHVCFTSGAVQDVRSVAEIAHRHGALLLVDGYHAAGQLPVDVQALDVDFYCAGGLKWLLGGSGIAFLYARPALQHALMPRVTGWFAHREQFRFDSRTLELHDDARRFESGTPAMAAVYAQLGGLDLLDQVGQAEIRGITMRLAEELIEAARAAGVAPQVPPDPARRSGIVSLVSDDPVRDVRRLAQAGIVTDARPGLVRVSPYFYNEPDDIRALVEQLKP
ncbi:MAG TPA: aminotransferase class V-fold PLP-dependent enzyme [Gemmatimonadales bacterium]|nr:aminotransferase class V-fold PLP-dependent enzyme [Gemmatimonadales bacterium]